VIEKNIREGKLGEFLRGTQQSGGKTRQNQKKKVARGGRAGRGERAKGGVVQQIDGESNWA